MNESDFVARWEGEKPLYYTWGSFVLKRISSVLVEDGVDLESFLKVPGKCRLKDNSSLVDKAFFRPEKTYTDPYLEIEDKVGVRFIVLLESDVERICDVIKSDDSWVFEECKNFSKDREKSPLLFTYQSVHYVLRPKGKVELDGLVVDETVPCEVQVRTLLQHAHSELTHDSIYKANRLIRPEVQRTVAKSMALIETADEFFGKVVNALESGVVSENKIVESLDYLFQKKTGVRPISQKSAICLWDAYEDLVTPDLVEKIEGNLAEGVYSVIEQKAKTDLFCRQGTILFVAWLLKRHRLRVVNDWPLPKSVLDPLANSLCVNIHS